MSAEVLAMLALFALALSLAIENPKIPSAEARKLRVAFAEALADPGGPKEKALYESAKRLQARYELDSLIAALRDGPAGLQQEPKARKDEKLERFDAVRYGYLARLGRESFAYGVDVPPGYDPDKPAALLLDPGHGSGAELDAKGKADFLPFFRNQATSADLENALIVRTEIVEQIGAGGKRDERSEDEVFLAFEALFRDLASRYAIDLDRVWVTGLSQTGFWSWMLGAQRPDRFAGIAPMGAVTWQVDPVIGNVAHLAVYTLHGESDKVCPVVQPRRTMDELAKRSTCSHYEEIAGAGHDGAVWGQLHGALRWLGERPRAPHPKQFAFRVRSEHTRWFYWVRLDALERPGDGKATTTPCARLAAEIDGQEIRLTSEGVRALSLALSRELVDLEQPVKVVWNGKQVYEGKPKRDFQDTVRIAVEKVDWKALCEALVELR